MGKTGEERVKSFGKNHLSNQRGGGGGGVHKLLATSRQLPAKSKVPEGQNVKAQDEVLGADEIDPTAGGTTPG